MAAVRHLRFVILTFEITLEEYLASLALCKLWLELVVKF